MIDTIFVINDSLNVVDSTNTNVMNLVANASALLTALFALLAIFVSIKQFRNSVSLSKRSVFSNRYFSEITLYFLNQYNSVSKIVKEQTASLATLASNSQTQVVYLRKKNDEIQKIFNDFIEEIKFRQKLFDVNSRDFLDEQSSLLTSLLNNFCLQQEKNSSELQKSISMIFEKILLHIKNEAKD